MLRLILLGLWFPVGLKVAPDLRLGHAQCQSLGIAHLWFQEHPACHGLTSGS